MRSTTSLLRITMTLSAFRWSMAFLLEPKRLGIAVLRGISGKQTGRTQGFVNFVPRSLVSISSSSLSSSSIDQETAAANVNPGSPRRQNSPAKSTNSTSRASNNSLNKNTGGLRRLPVAKSPKEISNRASKIARAVPVDSSIANVRARARKHGAETINAVTQALCIPLRDVVRGYQTELRRLHPFEKVVADLTIQARQDKDGVTLDLVLNEINEARKELLQAGKDWIAKAKSAETAREAGETREQGIEALVEMFDRLATPVIEQIGDLQRSLRTAPIVQLDTPAVVLVGAPNVGKSSIVRAISSATPEVNNYPFTTRAMTLGHVEVFWSSSSDANGSGDGQETPGSTSSAPKVVNAVIPQDTNKYRFRRHRSLSFLEPSASSSTSYAFSQLCQVMDSPGLLVRETEEDRNEMEKLTLASLQHLPTAVMFVMDLSGNAGDRCSSLPDQLALRRQIRSRFPRRPWIDVVSKIDLGIDEEAAKELDDILEGAPYIRLSIHESIGLDELRSQVLRMLGEVQLVLDAMAAIDERSARPE